MSAVWQGLDLALQTRLNSNTQLCLLLPLPAEIKGINLIVWDLKCVSFFFVCVLLGIVPQGFTHAGHSRRSCKPGPFAGF